MKSVTQFLLSMKDHDYLSLARVLTIVENDLSGSGDILRNLDINNKIPVIGVTGPPGAGKSSLVNSLIAHISTEGKKVAILAVDPTSPFNLGSLLGDRVRMSSHFNDPNVFIRSIATRGSLGGLSAKIIELVDVLQSACFDYIFVETVGVGQSEIEIAGLADATLIVLVPESGDEIQHIKSGLMEIGDAFIVNKSDREGASFFANQLTKMLAQRRDSTPVFKTVANRREGVAELLLWLKQKQFVSNERRLALYSERAFKLIQNSRMKDIDKNTLRELLSSKHLDADFNLYKLLNSEGLLNG